MKIVLVAIGVPVGMFFTESIISFAREMAEMAIRAAIWGILLGRGRSYAYR